jgi:large subunit ribosomal protein L21
MGTPSRSCLGPAEDRRRPLVGPPQLSWNDRRVLDERESGHAVYAIVRNGGRQEKVAVGDVIDLDVLGPKAGESLTLAAVLFVDGDAVTTDLAALAKVDVTAEVVGPSKGPKIHIMKYKNKTGYRKRQGHRQHYTRVKVTAISAG